MGLDVFAIALSDEKIGILLCPARDRILVEKAGFLLPLRPVGTQQNACHLAPLTGRQLKGRATFFYQHDVPTGQTTK